MRIAPGQVLLDHRRHERRLPRGPWGDAGRSGTPPGQRYGVPGQPGAYTSQAAALPLYYEAEGHEAMGGAVLEGPQVATET